MTTNEVAEKLVQYCREGKNIDAINELYADNIVSREQPGIPHEFSQGKNEVLGKNNEWYQSVEEIHSANISDPMVTGNLIAVAMEMDVTFKNSGRNQMSEIALYEVENGKIIKEQFFYKN
jgi:hypothetical protein